MSRETVAVWLVTCCLWACSGDSFYSIGPDRDAGPEAASSEDGSDAGSGADAAEGDAGDAALQDTGLDVSVGDACSVQAGPAACQAVIDVWCQRNVACCSGVCVESWRNDINACKSHYQCGSFTGKIACKTEIDACTTSIGGPACQVVTQAAASDVTNACKSFWMDIQ